MRLCSFCNADLNEVELRDGRCPVCGGIVAWDEQITGTLMAPDWLESPAPRAADVRREAPPPPGEPPRSRVPEGPAAPDTPPQDRASGRPSIKEIAATIVNRAQAPPPTAPLAEAAPSSRETRESRRGPPVAPPGADDQAPAPPPAALSADTSRQMFEVWKRSIQTDRALGIGHTIKDLASSEPPPAANLVIQNRVFRAVGEDVTAPADYELLEVIGEGGVGVVYAARQASINRTVAVKMLRPGREGDAQRGAFLAEAVVTGDLDHPNIVPVHDLGGNQAGALFYSMKRVRGTPWSQAMSAKSLPENLEILLKVCDAVAFAHSRNVVHRDLKPENVMLGDFGEVLVMDWGIALASTLSIHTGRTASSSSMGGTPAYMAPEMATGPIEKIGPHSDVYLLGGILFEILTGKTPHVGKSVMDCLMAAAENRLQPTDVTGELLQVAYQALATDPAERFDSVQAFQAAIRQYQSHSESLAMALRADEELRLAQQTEDYQHYSHALFGFQEALQLWDANHDAAIGVSRTQLAFAQCALQKADFDLGLSLLEPRNEAHAPLRRQLLAAQRERNAREQRIKRARRLVRLLVAAIFAIVTVAMVMIISSWREAKDNERQAIAAKEEADTQKQAAFSAKERSEYQEQEALCAKEDAEFQEREALIAKEYAEFQKQEALVAQKEAESARRREEDQNYISRIGLADEKIQDNAFLDAGDILDAIQVQDKEIVARRQRLDSMAQPRRNWEWGRLRYLCQRDALTLRAGGRIESLAMSADEQVFVTGQADGSLRVWKAWVDQPPQWQWQGNAPVLAVAVSPDSQFLAAADGAEIRIWPLSQDPAAPRAVRTLRGHDGPVLSLAFSRDGRRLASSSQDRSTRLWAWQDADSPLATLGGHHGPIWCVRFSRDGNRIVTAGDDKKVIVWELPADSRSANRVFRGHRVPVYTAGFSPDGRYVVSGDYDGRILIWEPDRVPPDITAIRNRLEGAGAAEDAEDGALQRELSGHADAVRAVAYSEDGRQIISSGNDNTVRIWSLERAPEDEDFVRVLRGHGGWVTAARFARQGRRAVSGGYDQRVKVWDLEQYTEFRTLAEHTDAVLGASFSPDGRQAVTASRDHTARLWNVEDGTSTELTEGHNYLTMRAEFFPDGKQMLTAAFDSTILKWDCATGGQVPFATTRRLEQAGRDGVMALSRTARWLLTGSDDNTATMWNPDTGEQRQILEGHLDRVTAVAFSPEEDLAFSGDARGHCLLWRWQAAAGRWEKAFELVGHRPGFRIQAAAFTADGQRLLTASDDHTVAQWDVATGQERKDLVLIHPDGVAQMDLSPDGRWALTGCSDRSVRLWDVLRARARVVDDGAEHPGNEKVDAVDFAPDGRSALVLWAAAQTVDVYRWPEGPTLAASPGRESLRRSFGALSSARFAPDGSQLLTVGGERARLWDLTAGLAPVMTFSPHGAVASAHYSPDGRYLATCDMLGDVKIWDVTMASPAVVLRIEHPHDGRAVRAAVFSPQQVEGEQRLLLTAGDDRKARFWKLDLAAGQAQLRATWEGHAGPLRSAAFSPDGAWVVTASEDRTARIWSTAAQAADPPLELAGHTLAVTAATFAPPSAQEEFRRLVATCSEDNTAVLWEFDPAARTVRQVRPLAGGHTAGITSIAFSPDGRRVLTGSQDNTAKLWETATGREIIALHQHRQSVNAVAFSPNTLQVLTADGEGTAILWPALPWQTTVDGMQQASAK